MKSRLYNEPRWKVRHMLHAIGSYRDISDMLLARGYPRLPEGTISAWASRNSIPSAWLPAVIELALEACVIGSISDLLEQPGRRRKVA